MKERLSYWIAMKLKKLVTQANQLEANFGNRYNAVILCAVAYLQRIHASYEIPIIKDHQFCEMRI